MPNETTSGDVPLRILASRLRDAADRVDDEGRWYLDGTANLLRKLADEIERGEWIRRETAGAHAEQR